MLDRPRDSKTGNSFYELVVARNFETIEIFLAKFNGIFSSKYFFHKEQDEFERKLDKFEQKVDTFENNYKKIEEKMGKTNENYDKKMASLKEFIVEKIESLDECLSAKNSESENNKKLSVLKEEFMEEAKGQFHLKFEEILSEIETKMELNLSNMSRKVNSLISLNENCDNKIECLLKKSSTIEEKNEFLDKKTEEIWNKAESQLCEINSKLAKIEKEELKCIEMITAHNSKFSSIYENCQQKLCSQTFQDFLKTFNCDQANLIKEFSENFCSKKEVKKMMNLLERKLFKLEVIEDILKDNNENDSKLAINSGSFHNKTRPLVIHNINKKSDKPFNKTNDSIHIRKLSKWIQLPEHN